MFIVIIGWVLFRSGTLTEARHFLKIMFSFNFNPTYNLMPSLINGKMILVLILGIIFCGPIQLLFNKLKSKQKLITLYQEKLRYFVIIIIMVICISELVASTYNPFIYFRF